MKIPSIPKIKDKSNYCFYTSQRSRDFFFYCLSNLNKLDIKKILIPSYIGYSESEGSGVMDAIIDSKVEYVIYPINKNLEINIKELKSIIRETDSKKTSLLLIHYFGLIDTNYLKIIEFAKEKDIFIFDDCAHSFYTYYSFKDYFKGDAAFFSVHKLLKNITPKSISLIKKNISSKYTFELEKLLNRCSPNKNYNMPNSIELSNNFDFFPTIKGIENIVEKRIIQANIYKELLDKSGNPFTILIPEKSYNFPLQSFPILFSNNVNRDNIYHRMRDLEIQVVSLYYNLTNKIKITEFPEAHYLSKNILNLPINEDLEQDQIKYICKSLLEAI